MDEQNQQQTLPPQQPPIPLQNLNPVPQPPQQRTWIKWVLVLVLVATLSSGATYLVLKSQSPKQPSPQIVQPTPTPTISQPSPTPDLYTEGTRSATTNWKIYTNEVLAFSLKIPPEWRSFEANDRVDFAKKEQPFPLKNDYWVQISVIPNMNQLSTEQVVDNYLNEKATYKDGQWVSINDMPEIAGRITKDYLTVSDTNAISLYPVPSATDTKHVYITTKENLYSIVLQAGSLPDLNQEAMSVFTLILSTFRFD
ncbi:MAG: hypothetical protein Q8Q96_00605 [bacterium]|nr:hypothetical protein [bacterium]